MPAVDQSSFYGARLLAHLSRVKSVTGALTSRRSIRHFLPDPIRKDTIEEILTLSRYPYALGQARSGTPTTGAGQHQQPWKVTVVSGWKKNQLVQALEEAQAPPMRQALDDSTEQSLASVQNQLDFLAGAPIGFIFTLHREMELGQAVDLGIFMQSMMLLARERGLHTRTQESGHWPEEVRNLLEISPDEFVFGGMAMGYSNDVDCCLEESSNNKQLLEMSRAELNEFVTFLDEDAEEDEDEDAEEKVRVV